MACTGKETGHDECAITNKVMMVRKQFSLQETGNDPSEPSQGLPEIPHSSKLTKLAAGQ